MRNVLRLTITFAVLAIAGCGGGSRSAAAPLPVPADGALHKEGGAMAPFYGEVFHNNRFYVFGTKPELAKFEASKSPILATKMFIGKGPSKKTVIAETSKDSPQMTQRLLDQLNGRYGNAQ